MRSQAVFRYPVPTSAQLKAGDAKDIMQRELGGRALEHSGGFEDGAHAIGLAKPESLEIGLRDIQIEGLACGYARDQGLEDAFRHTVVRCKEGADLMAGMALTDHSIALDGIAVEGYSDQSVFLI